MTLPPAFLDRPIAHRALHDSAVGRPENSLSAVQAAVDAGYGIEIDLQLSADGEAMVFHDYDLGRLTDAKGAVRQRSAAELAAIPLLGGIGETIPVLAQVLVLVDGTVPLLIELKDQDGALGPVVGPLEDRVAELLADYTGPVAVMSFNPHSVARLAERAPQIPRGLTTERFPKHDWPGVPETRLTELQAIPDLKRTGASFISHHAGDLRDHRVREVKKTGLPVLCWTIRSAQAEAEAREIADNITFEGYAA